MIEAENIYLDFFEKIHSLLVVLAIESVTGPSLSKFMLF